MRSGVFQELDLPRCWLYSTRSPLKTVFFLFFYFSNVQHLKNISVNFLNFSNTKYILVETKPSVFNPFSSKKRSFCYWETMLF